MYVRKKKGIIHHNWSDTYYDWTINKIEFDDCNYHKPDSNIKEEMEKIHTYVEEHNKNRKEKAKQYAEILVYLKEKYNLVSYLEAAYLCQKVFDKRYDKDVKEILGVE